MRTLEGYQTKNGPSWLVEFKDIDDEIRFLRNLINRFRVIPLIRNLAVQIVLESGCQQKDKRCQALAIGTWVQDHIYYIHELPERFQYPDETLRLKAGDCDDFTTLIGSLLESIGISCQMVVMKIDGNWAHIFPAARLTGVNGDALLPLDATLTIAIRASTNPITVARQRGSMVFVKLA